MCTVHHCHVCIDVYLQGSWLTNEKIEGSRLQADVKAVSHTLSCAAFMQERARPMEEGKLFFLYLYYIATII